MMKAVYNLDDEPLGTQYQFRKRVFAVAEETMELMRTEDVDGDSWIETLGGGMNQLMLNEQLPSLMDTDDINIHKILYITEELLTSFRPDDTYDNGEPFCADMAYLAELQAKKAALLEMVFAYKAQLA